MSAVLGIAMFIALFVAFGFLWRGKEDAGHGAPCPSVTDSPACGACPLAEKGRDNVLDFPSGRPARPTTVRFQPRRNARQQWGKSPIDTAASPVPLDCPIIPAGASTERTRT